MAGMSAPAFDTVSAPDLEGLTPEQLDELPFGTIQLDRDDVVIAYNAAESRLAKRSSQQTLGKHFFDEVAPCTNESGFRGLMDSLDERNRSATTDFVFRFSWGPERVRVRFLLSSDGTRWVFVTPVAG